MYGAKDIMVSNGSKSKGAVRGQGPFTAIISKQRAKTTIIITP